MTMTEAETYYQDNRSDDDDDGDDAAWWTDERINSVRLAMRTAALDRYRTWLDLGGVMDEIDERLLTERLAEADEWTPADARVGAPRRGPTGPMGPRPHVR